ncbi:M56 family metallopeptidase [Gulosibacter chungangensis]|uniref:M56 family metallopeptidase n=1 Tax=Gulosibacter chungangensis TaxID=979746 RepID=A0A7J5B9T0_9MICO|nr:M56 family metallopeptidase [Gulosibacter chungangensis]KAB1641434.1 M56 family metallopeptidase [Gulosibacter chungangensis]
MLPLALTLLGTAVALALLCPHLLTKGRWQLFHPRAALTIWFGSFGLGATAALFGFALGVVAIESVRHANPHTPGVAVTEAIWVAAGISGLAAAFVFLCAGSLQSLHPDLHSQAIAYARDEHIGFTLVRFHSDMPEAYAVPGRRPEIFVSSAMGQLLTAPQLQAVLAHEFAHLRHRHGLAMRIAQLNALFLPGTRIGRALERATRLQIELAADDAAARQVGAVHLANALTVLATATQDVGMTLRAQRLTQKRWPAAQRRRLPQGLRAAPQLR